MAEAKIKILYIITKSNWGGAQRYVFDLATSLPKDRFEVSVLLGGEGALKDRLADSGIRTVTLPRLGRNVSITDDWAVFWELVSFFKKERPDVIHLNSSKIGGLGALAGRFAGVKKIIFTAHGWAFNEPRPLWQRLIILKLHWVTVMLCHCTIAVSGITKRQMVLPFAQRKITVIHNGIAPFGHLDRAAARAFLVAKDERLQNASNDPWVGTIAELHKNKGFIYALEAMHELKNEWPPLRFIILGEGEERTRLETYIRERHLEDRVFLIGHVNEAPRLLKAFDVFLFPSVKEGLPYALLEAGTVGLPVIATSTGGIPEIIDDGKTGLLIEPSAASPIRTALATLMHSHELALKFSKNIQEKISREFSLEKMVEATIKLYR